MALDIKSKHNPKAQTLKENIALNQTLSTKTCEQHNGLQEPVQCNISLRNNNKMNHK